MKKWGGRAAFVAIVLAVLWAAFRSTQPDRAEKKRRLGEADTALLAASKELLAREIPGLSLELSLREVLKVRPMLKRYTEGDRDGLKVFHESLSKDHSALYFFDAETGGIGRLRRVQIAGHVKNLEAVVARVQARETQLGPPSGVWDCPPVPGQLASRRYTYKRGAASAMEIYVLVGQQTGITYYVGSTNELRASLEQAACTPTPPERAARFPVAVP